MSFTLALLRLDGSTILACSDAVGFHLGEFPLILVLSRNLDPNDSSSGVLANDLIPLRILVALPHQNSPSKPLHATLSASLPDCSRRRRHPPFRVFAHWVSPGEPLF